ncbi:choice-of-anchor I family protein [Shimia sp. CNT1-13L.2]|uniref:choice-of-anchor I family protein n=1 Tax=Shimia sp. CNT1-13L.2 TaxID=2959663 RepID=UPI0020CB71F4|nr:choice-of-anchor I family protein [Shimia sp. CNT1-13L.2]MCP9482805.1 choice-of-anchor I family protein [Shimia sp. CNT1-13L.2]
MTPLTTTRLNTLGFEEAVTFDSGAGEGGSEVVSFHDGKLYVTNGEQDRVDIINATTGVLISSIDLSTIPGFDGINSVAASAAGVAVAVERDIASFDNGVVALFALDGTPNGTVEAGNLPDMVTFSKDGTKIFVANEGEPTDSVDPAGSISIIDVATKQVQTFDFSAFDTQVAALEAAGVRIFPGKLPSTDFEPEYIAEGDNGKLYVTLQEANAVAVFDLTTMQWDEILPLGTVDHSVEGFGMDANDKDDAIDIKVVNTLGLRMPDALATAEIGGKTYFLTANEGDDRGDFDEGGDAARVKDILDGDVAGVSIDASVDTTGLERLNVSIIDGDTDNDGDIDVLHSYGSRSFTIYDADGNVVFDSGDDFEQWIAANRPANAFNNDDYPSDDAGTVDENRSDNKGPEPEAIAVGEVEGVTLAFIGLERDSGIMIYDITDPANASFLTYIEGQGNGNVSPEVIDFIPASESATGVAQIAVSYEVSGTTAVFDLQFGQQILGTNAGEMIKGGIGADEILAGFGHDTVVAGSGDDFVRAGFGHDDISGRAGDDNLRGFWGHDTIRGGAGDDTLGGGVGKDRLIGGTGDDVMKGFIGKDVFVFDLGAGDDVILDLTRKDRIDLSATGLSFADLTITDNGSDNYTVEYGAQGDSIDVTLAGNLTDLTEDSFLF